MLRILMMALSFCGAAQALELAQIREKAAPSMVLVRALGDDERLIRTGGGIVIERGQVVTNCRVLVKAKSLQVRYQDIIYPATLHYADIERDLCRLDVQKISAPALPIGGVQSVRLRQKVYILSASRVGELSFIEARVSALREQAGTPVAEITAGVVQAAGAAAILDDDGRLIGITASRENDAPGIISAVLTDALNEIPQRAQQALEHRQRAPVIAPSMAGEWAPRIALLEKARGELTLSKALAILLDITSEEDLNSLLVHEEVVTRKDWHNAYAMGVDQKGNLIWGGGYRLRSAADAMQTAVEHCATDSRNSCTAILVNGEFRENDFFGVAKQLSVHDMAATRKSFLDSLAKRPAEARVGLAASAGGGTEDYHYSYGYSSIRN